MSSSVRPHRQQSTRLPRPWDSPGKNTGVGCHFLLQCMKVKSESEVAQSCLTLSDPMDCSLPGSSIYGIFQARVIEWGAIILRHFMLQERGSGLPRCLTVPDWEWEERRQNWRPELRDLHPEWLAAPASSRRSLHSSIWRTLHAQVSL